MKDSTTRHTSSVRSGLKRQMRNWLLSIVAVLFTLAPLISLGIWVKNAYFIDSRTTSELGRLEVPANPPKLFREPIVTVTFDDGWESAYSEAAPILEKYGVRTTQYILSGFFNHPSYLSKKQVLSLQAAGHDIQSHTITHADLRQLSDEDLDRELAESKTVIGELTNTAVTDFASPLNGYDDRTLEAIQGYYRSHRTTEADLNIPGDHNFNLRETFDPWKIIAYSVRRTTTTEDIERYLSEARDKKAWVVLIYHEVDDKSESYYAVTPEQFDSQMRVVADSRLRIATIKEVIDYYYEVVIPAQSSNRGRR
jgi:peptidoglycan/xylan/chitin deacetylase (PgdA/CDA1 family)